MLDTPPDHWRKCTTCKKLIHFGQVFWVCSVSTCTRQRTGLVFCTVTCFDIHVPILNHKNAGAIEKRAPTLKQYQEELARESAPRTQATSDSSAGAARPAVPRDPVAPDDEILVVVSKVKAYIRDRSGMNTSESVMRLLSQKIRRMADDAIGRANQDARKTVLDRDVR
jgi:hypothetical protein